jgi:hypothetical protein
LRVRRSENWENVGSGAREVPGKKVKIKQHVMILFISTFL